MNYYFSLHFSVKLFFLKNLIIIRHAKSSWDDPVSDQFRVLIKRGRDDIRLVSEEFKKCFLTPHYTIFCSTAKRAIETATIFSKINNYKTESIIFRHDIYTFDCKELEKVIKNFENRYQNVILFGHNEAITKFVNKFADSSLTNIPTSGLVSIEFDCDDWLEIKNGIINKVIFPREF